MLFVRINRVKQNARLRYDVNQWSQGYYLDYGWFFEGIRCKNSAKTVISKVLGL